MTSEFVVEKAKLSAANKTIIFSNHFLKWVAIELRTGVSMRDNIKNSLSSTLFFSTITTQKY